MEIGLKKIKTRGFIRVNNDNMTSTWSETNLLTILLMAQGWGLTKAHVQCVEALTLISILVRVQAVNSKLTQKRLTRGDEPLRIITLEMGSPLLHSRLRGR